MWHLVSGGLRVEIQAGTIAEATWCVRASLFSLGAIRQTRRLPFIRFEIPVRRDTLRHSTAHTSRWKSTGLRQVKISNVQFPYSGPVNYWTELFLLIHALVCTHWISYLSNTPVHSHTWLQALSCMFLKLEQIGLSMANLVLFLVVLKTETSTYLSPSRMRRRIAQARVSITEMHNQFVLPHIICLLSKQMTLMMRANDQIKLLFIPWFHSSLIGR